MKIARHGYERGIRFFDMADMYGSQPFVGKALKELPREKLTLMTKMWTTTKGRKNASRSAKTLNRFRQERVRRLFRYGPPPTALHDERRLDGNS